MILKLLMTSCNLKQIAISPENYTSLKRLGGAGDSFNDVLTKILQQLGSKDWKLPGEG
jgi:predicted CopG family antitoxin